MSSWEPALRRWTDAGLVDADAAGKIRRWERDRVGEPNVRWPARLALAVGGLMVGAGILLFVAAHWDALSPGWRFGLILLLVGGFHLAGAAAATTPALAATLHACGTVALGAGIFLTGQIFHLQEHWSGGLLLWAVGAWAGWAVLRQWPQGALAAVLTPAWLAGEWIARSGNLGAGVAGAGLVLFAAAYVGAEPDGGPAAVPRSMRRALVWIGGVAIIPAALWLVSAEWWAYRPGAGGWAAGLLAWALVLGLPLGISVALRGSGALPMVPITVWVAIGPWAIHQRGPAPYLWAVGLAGFLLWWGLRDRRSTLVNLGVAGFALTVLIFYFSDVMDRLGRSASLVGMGLLLLGGGYLLERARRRLLGRFEESGT
ncbi:MAG TPA: DUF2157 domain-containing protein [Gemmatimonadales bacterium]|nr:DUF2157 domain-containing protein [Gemmatimonadales bacterium]